MSNEKYETNQAGSQNQKSPATSPNQEADKKANQNWNENAPKTGVKPTTAQAQENEENTKTGYKPEDAQKNKQQMEDRASQPKTEAKPENNPNPAKPEGRRN